ncbi:cation-transporting P-type ATPase [Corallococcus sp. bb12-1]|uniref:cation-translocating P-type ATPase n=1 Tax=Corallococcus sp. bb12-1 TaxID=2996784 RepID=UPI00226F9BEC|nr:cation-transporting P-type ATPase [Corallococcus sp. bb12-1]MCY1044559.1 cation-transporting P-type ATPase [Corallococcus sp. bb12-1]
MVVFLMDGQFAPARVVRHSTAARRLRLEVPGLQWDRFLSKRLERTFATWPGIEEASAEPRTGRLLVRYAPEAPLLARLRQQPDEPVAWPAPHQARPVPGTRSAPREPWHAMTVEAVLARLDGTDQGLSSEEAARRLKRFGLNFVVAEEPRSRLAMLGAQLATVPTLLLLGSAGASALTGDGLEATAILAVVGLNAGIGYRIEHRNQELLSSWQKLEAGAAQVLRGGVLLTVPVAELVPGDVVLLRAGDVLPADVRVLDAHRLSADESPLTGESEPQAKQAAPVEARAPLAERACLLFAGTSVASGHGRALVVATGADTELARVRELVAQEAAPPTPLTRKMDKLNRRVAVASVGAASLSALAGLAHGRSGAQVLRGAVALGVAALPEGLPLVSTAALVRAMQRLYARGMVVRRVSAAEALGGVTVICTDKTGTLTRNEMRLDVLDLGDGPLELSSLRARPQAVLEDPPTLALALGLLNSDVDVHRSGKEMVVSGSSTEKALVAAAHAAGLDGAALRRDFPRRHLRERSEGIHYVVSVHRAPGGEELAFVKGAPEQVLALCERDSKGPLDARARERLARRNDALAADGLRVLGLAWRQLPGDGGPAPTDGYTFIGFVGLRDPLREGAAESVRQARGAGIRTVVLTGDQLPTAEAIARRVGLEGDTLTPLALAEMLDLPGDALSRRLDRVAVLARVTPENKRELVKALRARGEIVAMAGDGINDAPALQAADVGVAVGVGASDMARAVADVVMASEDLRSIMSAVGEGRIVQDNLRRALRFLFATNLSETALVLSAGLLGLSEPLTPLQLLWINLLTDTLPGVALAMEPGDPAILDRPPAPPGMPLLTRPAARRVMRDGALMACVGGLGMALGGPPLAFGTLTAVQLGYSVVCRAPRQARRHIPSDGEWRLPVFLGGAAAVHMAALTLPPLRRVLGLPAPTLLTFGGLAVGLVLPTLMNAAPAWGGRGVRRVRHREAGSMTDATSLLEATP